MGVLRFAIVPAFSSPVLASISRCILGLRLPTGVCMLQAGLIASHCYSQMTLRPTAGRPKVRSFSVSSYFDLMWIRRPVASHEESKHFLTYQLTDIEVSPIVRELPEAN